MLQTRLGDLAAQWKTDRKGLNGGSLIVVFFLLMLLVLSRRPQDVLHAQFYAEDGKRWFAQAYNLGWLHSLLVPDSGYLQVLPRLPAGLALLLPLRWAPLILNLAGAAIQVLPAVLLISAVCAGWGSLPVRAVMAALYIAEPNAWEIHVNITNAQWHYALLELLLVFAPTPRTWLGKTVVFLVFVLGACSGPFGIALLPVMAIYWFVRRHRWTLVLAAVVAVGTLVQVRTFHSGVIFSPSYDTYQATRVDAEQLPLGATPKLFVEIVGDDLVLNSIVGYGGVRVLRHVPLAGAVAFFLLGVFVVYFAMRRGPLEYRLLGLFTLILFAASLKSPVVLGSGTRWQMLLDDVGMRYYFLPSLVFLWALAYCAWQLRLSSLRLLARVSVVLILLWAVRRWEYPREPDLHYAAEVQRFEHAPQGEVVHIPIVPSPWSMALIKH